MRDAFESKALQREIKEVMAEKIQQLKKAGHTVEPIDFPLSEYILPTYYILATAEAVQTYHGMMVCGMAIEASK